MSKHWENYEDREPTEDELKEIEELLSQIDESESFDDGYIPNRSFYHYTDFDKFKIWLSKNGMLW